MQTDQQLPHRENPSPLPPPSPTLYRHHNPGDPAEPPSHLRHRLPRTRSHDTPAMTASSTANPNSMRIRIQTPYGDSEVESAKRKEGWAVSRGKTVGELKDELGRGGLEGAGVWEREGMRMVYHGRIVRDHERLDDVVGKTQTSDPAHVYTFHLVARRFPTTPLANIVTTNPIDNLVAQATLHAASAAAGASAQVSTAEASGQPGEPEFTSANSLALSDSIHYLLFTARHHLFCLLGKPPLRWDEMVPPPVLGMDEAREAVMGVVRAFGEYRGDAEEGWERWEWAFEGDGDEGLKGFWERLGGRKGVEREIGVMWSGIVGKGWDDAVRQKVDVEVDGSTQTLYLPAMSESTPPMLTHLLIYLAITSLLPHLNAALYQAMQEEHLASLHPAPTPTRTINPTPTLAAPGPTPGRTLNNLRLSLLPLSLLYDFVFSAIKVGSMAWMLTRGMKWSDSRFWMVAGVACGWWMVEVVKATQAHLTAQRAREAAERALAEVAEDAAGAGAGAGARQNGAAPANILPEPPFPFPQAGRARNPFSLPPVPSFSFLPTVSLSIDNAQLRLPPPSLSPTTTPAPAPRRTPPRAWTQFGLPVLLWVVTLIPGWEAARAKAIKERERRMRVLVGEMRAAAAASAAAAAPPQTEGAEDSNASPAPAVEEPQINFPPGISLAAQKYYTRVMARGEGIDWEEEREAQLAMAAVEEDEAGDDMRLRML
ncbi:hypothetical protein IAT38_000655 [Cryptococcus sp. DSM 104549]